MIFKPVKKAELHLRAKGLQFLLISNAQLRMLPPLEKSKLDFGPTFANILPIRMPLCSHWQSTISILKKI